MIKLSWFFAKRYLVAKKSNNVINLITAVSISGIVVGVAALIIVLSVFNGFEKIVVNLFNSFNPELVIKPKEGKTFDMLTFKQQEVKNIRHIKHFVPILEENALIKYKDKQCVVSLKGVGDEFVLMSPIDSFIIDGSFILKQNKQEFAILGSGVAYSLSASVNDFINPLTVYLPRRGKTISLDPSQAFNEANIFPSGIFTMQQEFDSKYVIVPIDFVRKLLEYSSEATAIEIGLEHPKYVKKVQQELQKILGANFVIHDRFEQEETLYKIMRSEKWAIFFILTFILIIAAFTIVGALSMLIIEKKQDVVILFSMGANSSVIKTIFAMEGLLISVIGGLGGMILGGIICWIQMKYGLIKLSETGNFITNSYPVSLKGLDFVYVFITVVCIGVLAAIFPVKMISKNWMQIKLNNC